MTVDTIVIWDSPDDPPAAGGLVFTWDGHADVGTSRSLFAYVEANAKRLRGKYLAFIHDLGERIVEGKRIIDHLEVSDGFSFWWLTRLAEKNFSKSPIDDIIRLFALEELLATRRPQKLLLVSSDARIDAVLAALCQASGISYECHIPPKAARLRTLRSVYDSLPHSVRAAFSLARYLWIHWPSRNIIKADWFGGDDSVSFFSYFENVDLPSAERGEFHSRFWTGMRSILKEAGLHANWLHLFVPSDTIPSARTAVGWAQRFNRRSESEGAHSFLGSYLSLELVFGVLIRWFHLWNTCGRLRGIPGAFRPQDSAIDLWPLLRGEWFASMRGPDSIINMLEAALIDRAVQSLPPQRMGLYLSENLPWERALAHSWRKHGHSHLIAVVHSTMRFWDLRYFIDTRTIHGAPPSALPQPDLIALNGKAAIDSYLEAGGTQATMLECEALRYGYLQDLPAHQPRPSGDDAPIRVLVVGDFLPADTNHLLILLSEATALPDIHATFAIKAHPNCPVNETDFPALNMQMLSAPLGELFHRFDLVCASSKTSAALDAYLTGLPVIVTIDNSTLNFNPLRGQRSVRFVSTGGELAEALREANRMAASPPKASDFFFLDPSYPRWRKILSISPRQTGPLSLPR